jgi:hypothetical protein
MRMATHLLKKDLRRVRWLLAAWAIVLATRSFLSVAAFASAPGDMMVQLVVDSFSLLLPLLQLVLVLALIPLVVQEEPLVGTTAYWLTRPISGGTLLTAKALFLVIFFVLLPVSVETLNLAANGVIIRHLTLLMPHIFLEYLVYILPLWALAAMTANLARFAVIGGISFVAFILAGAVIASAKALTAEGLEWGEVVALGPTTSLGLAAILLAFPVATAHQYLTRKTRRSVAMLLGTVVLVSAVSLVEPRPQQPFFPPQRDRAILDPAEVGVELDLQSVSTRDAFSFRRTQPIRLDVMARIQTHGVPPGQMIQPNRVRTSLHFPDGTRVQFLGPTGRFWHGPDPDALRHALGASTLVNPRQLPLLHESDVRISRVQQSLYRSYGNTAGTLTADIVFLISRYRVLEGLPLQEGAGLRRGSDSIRIENVLREPGGMTVAVREGRLRVPGRKAEEKLREPRHYVLFNERRRQAVLATERPLVSPLFFGGLTVGRTQSSLFESTSLLLRFSEEGDGKLFQVDEEWLEGAQLVRVEVEELGWFPKSIQTGDFRMRPEPGQPE